MPSGGRKKSPPYFIIVPVIFLQSNFDGSNTDGSFTIAYSNSFLSPYGIFPIALSYFIMKLYVACTH